VTLTLILFKYVFATAFCCSFFIVWFKTDFLVDYLKIFKLNKLKSVREFFLLEEYELAKKDEVLRQVSPILNYSDFLAYSMPEDEPSLGKLLSCKYCLGFWLSIFSCFLAHIVVGGAISSFVFVLPIVYTSSLLLYSKSFEE